MLKHYPKLNKLFNKALKKGKRDGDMITIKDKKFDKELSRVIQKSFKKADIKNIDNLIDTVLKT